jgi:hypothetical protein
MKDLNLRRMCRLINGFGEIPQGRIAKKQIKINTFEAGMYMKTNKSQTK